MDITDLEKDGGAVPSGWTGVSLLDFHSPNDGNGGALDGNLAANRVAGITSEILASVPDGSYLALRWYDSDDAGTDHGLAIDNLDVQFGGEVPEPGALVMLVGMAVTGLALRRRNRLAN